MKFVADSMLGKLAKWLRVLGYDTYYQPYDYRAEEITHLVKQGRILLSRQRLTIKKHSSSLLLQCNRVGEQLVEVKEALHLSPESQAWFSLCLICNVGLKPAREDVARENVPEYVFYHNMKDIRICPSCGRYYWPGSHRTAMIKQLESWGISHKQEHPQ